MSPIRPRYLALLAILSSAACSDGTAPSGPPAAIRAIAGNNQAGTVGEELAVPIKVRVSDADGRAVGGVSVTFNAAVGSGAVSTASVWAATAAVVTNSDGEAEVVWRLGITSGTHRVSAEIATADDLSVTFTATAAPGPPASLGIISGNGQLGAIGTTLEPFRIILHDAYNNACAGAEVEWEIEHGSGTLTSEITYADDNGMTQVELHLGNAAGIREVVARSGDAGPVSFMALGLVTIVDPPDDLLGTSPGYVPPDITSLGAAVDNDDNLVVFIEFVDIVTASYTPDPNDMIGIVDIDSDQDSLTGYGSIVDDYRPGQGSTGLGVDYFVGMISDRDRDYVVARLISEEEGIITGFMQPRFDANTVKLTIPLYMLDGDDGSVNLAVVVASPGAVTDIAPNDGHLILIRGGIQGAPAVVDAVPQDATREVTAYRQLR